MNKVLCFQRDHKRFLVFDSRAHFPEMFPVMCIRLGGLVPVGKTFTLNDQFPPGNNALSGVTTGCAERLELGLSVCGSIDSNAASFLVEQLMAMRKQSLKL